MTYKDISRFVQKEGRVDVIDTEGKTKMLDDGPDSINLATLLSERPTSSALTKSGTPERNSGNSSNKSFQKSKTLFKP